MRDWQSYMTGMINGPEASSPSCWSELYLLFVINNHFLACKLIGDLNWKFFVYLHSFLQQTRALCFCHCCTRLFFRPQSVGLTCFSNEVFLYLAVSRIENKSFCLIWLALLFYIRKLLGLNQPITEAFLSGWDSSSGHTEGRRHAAQVTKNCLRVWLWVWMLVYLCWTLDRSGHAL